MAVTEARPDLGLSREQLADLISEVLTNEPQTQPDLARKLNYPLSAEGRPRRVFGAAIQVLEARGEAVSLGRSVGYVLPRRGVKAKPVEAVEYDFPYKPAVVKLAHMFVDKNYQRPLTTFVEKIRANFDPLLMQVLALSDRGKGNKPARYAVIDGQTRWVAASQKGVGEWLAIVFAGLTQQQEAELFARFQRERRAMTSWDRFRAELAANNEEAKAIKVVVEATGYKLGNGKNELRAVAALEVCYRRSPFLLERTLSDFREAFPDALPETSHIRGLHYWLLNRNGNFRKKEIEVDDERLVRRLRQTGLDGLKRKASAAREAGTGHGGGSDIYMAQAIQAVYAGR